MSQPQANAKRPAPPTGSVDREWTEGLVQASRSVPIRACRRPKETRESRERAPMARHVRPSRLLRLDDGGVRFGLLFDLFGFLLGHGCLHGAGRAVPRLLRL